MLLLSFMASDKEKQSQFAPEAQHESYLTELTNGSYDCLPPLGQSSHFLECFGLPQPHRCISLSQQMSCQGVLF